MDDHIVVSSTSNQSADVETPLVLREGVQTRLVFKATLVKNTKQPEATIDGTLCYQRKRKNDEWDDVKTIPLTSLKAGEGYKLELHASEVLALYQQLDALYKISSEVGGLVGTKRFVKADADGLLVKVAQLLREGRAKELLQVFLDWADSQTAEALKLALVETDSGALVNFDAAVGAARLQRFVDAAAANLDTASEKYWQDLLAENAWAVSQIYAHPLVIIREQAYVGGKTIANQEGSVVDYLFSNSLTGNPLLVEIKTPRTDLVESNKEYRNQVFAPASELVAGVQQLVHARLSLITNYDSLTRNDDASGYKLFHPRALLIAGSTQSLKNDTLRRNFEMFRGSLRDLDIVTFDELVEKARALLRTLES